MDSCVNSSLTLAYQSRHVTCRCVASRNATDRHITSKVSGKQCSKIPKMLRPRLLGKLEIFCCERQKYLVSVMEPTVEEAYNFVLLSQCLQ